MSKERMQAMIFAAGLGTRLKPLTDTMPKALVRVGGEPLLKRVIFKLQAAGVERIVINVHHFSGQIKDYLSENDKFQMDLRISDETTMLLETGGGLKKARSLFYPDIPVLIHNVDILSNVDLGAFYRAGMDAHAGNASGAKSVPDALLLVSQRVTRRYLLFDDEMRLVGWTNVQTGEVKSPFPWVKTSLASLHRYAFSGIHLFSPRLFPLMDTWPEKFPIMDFYLSNCDRITIRGYVQENLKLMDVGKQETLKEAEDFLKVLK